MNKTKMIWGSLILLLLSHFAILSISCSSQKAVVQAADIVNEVARKGDQIDAVTVDLCNEAEKKAVELPKVEDAEKAIKLIRENCDRAFAAVDALDEAIKQVDLVFDSVQSGLAGVPDLVNSAMVARQQFTKAQQINEEVKSYLERTQ